VPNKTVKNENQQMVVKANDLIQRSKYTLSLQEQRLVQFVISKITPEMTELQEITIDIQDVCRLMGLNEKSGGNYAYIKNSLKSVRDRSVWIKLASGYELTFSWFSSVLIKENSGKVTLMFDKLTAPFLLQLQKQYTEYALQYTLAMKSAYSIRLYELLKSYQHLGELTITVKDFRDRVDATSDYYSNFGKLRQKVIDLALREIEGFTDLSVGVETIRKGRSIYALKFNIKEKLYSYKTYDEQQHYIAKNVKAKNKKSSAKKIQSEGQIAIDEINSL
jgi:plasmid replication initiation protein